MASNLTFVAFRGEMRCMEKEFITSNFKETQKLGELLARELRGGEIICLSGDLGAGKTTFTQGLLRGLKVKGPYTSPTFLVMKEYKQKKRNIYHIDAYRVNAKDILNLGWEEIVADKSNVIIVEWAEKIKKIIPKSALWLKLQWVSEKKRKIVIN